jgi:DNA polymerase-3 subunit delta'
MSADAEGASPPTPRETPELMGQEAAETVLLQAADLGRLAHAWLLTGPRGIGKATPPVTWPET